jgi:hypothetical protein
MAVRGAKVQPDALAQLIDRADKVVVYQSGTGGNVLYESGERADLDALRTALAVNRPEDDVHCMCVGSPMIKLFRDGQEIGRVTNHHAVLLRCNLWKSDAPLKDSETFLKWFDERKIPSPRAEWDENRRRDLEHEAHRKKWLAAMPASLPPLWQAAEQAHRPDLDPLRAALGKEFPDEHARAMALFAWYGSGAGPWSGYPGYESVAEDLLLDFPTETLLKAIEGRELTPAQTEGVARFFGGWTFSKKRPNDLKLLRAELKKKLLEHSLTGDDEDKHGRARHAFAE